MSIEDLKETSATFRVNQLPPHQPYPNNSGGKLWHWAIRRWRTADSLRYIVAKRKKINIFFFQWDFNRQIYLPPPFQLHWKEMSLSLWLALVSARLFWFPKIFSKDWRAACIFLSPMLFENESVSLKGPCTGQSQSVLTIWNDSLLRGKASSVHSTANFTASNVLNY